MPYSDPRQQSAYQNEWMQRRRTEWLAVNGPCVDCGTWENLQVDHVDPSTKVTHRVWSWARIRRDAELAKCVVRCEPCHKIKTVSGGERAWGERNGRAKLTADQVRAIRASDLPHTELGRKYDVSEAAIRRIRKGITYVRVI